jgi:hypothetical protein
MVGLGIGTALAASLVMATGASAALPEVGRCVAKTGGKYTSSTCTTLAKTSGAFEWEPGALAARFSFKVGTVTFENELERRKFTTCKAGGGEGEYIGSGEVKITKLEFTGCEFHEAKDRCQTEAAEGNSTEGKINFYALNGELGKITGTKAGILLTGTVANPFGPTPVLGFWECGGKLSGKGIDFVVEEGVIGEVTATDKMSLTAKDKFAKNLTTGKQAITHFEGEADEHELVVRAFNSALAETQGMTAVMTWSITNEEPLEIKAK